MQYFIKDEMKVPSPKLQSLQFIDTVGSTNGITSFYPKLSEAIRVSSKKNKTFAYVFEWIFARQGFT